MSRLDIKLELRRRVNQARTRRKQEAIATITESMGRRMARFNHDFPTFELVIIKVNHGDNTFDVERPGGGLRKKVRSIIPRSYQWLAEGMPAVMGHYDRDKERPYLRGLAGNYTEADFIAPVDDTSILDLLCPGWFRHRNGFGWYYGALLQCIDGTADGGYCGSGSGSGSGDLLGSGFGFGSGSGSGEIRLRKCKSFDWDLESMVEEARTDEIGLLRSYAQFLYEVSGQTVKEHNLLQGGLATINAGGEVWAVSFNPYAKAIMILASNGNDETCDTDLRTCSDHQTEGYDAGYAAGEAAGYADGLAAEGDGGAPFPGPSYDETCPKSETTELDVCYCNGYRDGYAERYDEAFYDAIDGWNDATDEAESEGQTHGDDDCNEGNDYKESFDDTYDGECPFTESGDPYRKAFCVRYPTHYAEQYDQAWEDAGCTIPP